MELVAWCLAQPPVFRLAARDGARIDLASDGAAIAHIFVLEDDIIRVAVLPDGRFQMGRTWAIAPGAEDVADRGPRPVRPGRASRPPTST